jgi:hypothetical protein
VIRGGGARPRHQSALYPALSAANQRQGRALHGHADHRVGIRACVRPLPLAHASASTLSLLPQHRKPAQRARWSSPGFQTGSHAVNNVLVIYT